MNLVKLFLAVDATFLRNWNEKSNLTCCSKSWLTELLRRLETHGIALGESLETHYIDIAVSQQWLQILIWQTMVRHGLLSLNSAEGPFSLKYPIKLAKYVIETISQTSQATLDSHGIGMVSLSCVLSCTSSTTHT